MFAADLGLFRQKKPSGLDGIPINPIPLPPHYRRNNKDAFKRN
jgi:hypothetical protein